jgi:ubiquinone/menaquinone biosynthesis C-methylase UbiE
MGELFPTNLDLTTVHQALDIACGPGQWVIDVAQNFPHIHVTGIDISQLMIAYANHLTRGLPNAHFQIMDVRQSLHFPDNSFNFVQARLIAAFMLASDWPRLLAECHRMLQPGGMLRLIECESLGMSNSAALEQYNAFLALALRRAGHAFAPAGNMCGITPVLPRLLREQGFQDIQRRAYALDSSAGTEANAIFYSICKTAMKLLQPFLIQWEATTQQEIDGLYQQALEDIQAPNFCGVWFYLSASSKKTA